MHEVANEHMLENILANNEELANHNRGHLDELNAWTVNIMSAPGAGKTRLLEATLLALGNNVSQPAVASSHRPGQVDTRPAGEGLKPTERSVYRITVIEGDMVGELDKQRLSKTGVPVLQISTGRSCHLDAQMIARLLHAEKLERPDIIFIENVGNLVCPAEFPLGEHKRIVLLSVTEGDDKPIKYPVIFRNCDAVILTKTDLLPYVDFKIAAAKFNIEALNAGAKIFTVSSMTGEGMTEWLAWLKDQLSHYRQQFKGAAQHSNFDLNSANRHVKNLNSGMETYTISAHQRDA